MTPYIIGIAVIELSRLIGKNTERKKNIVMLICASVFILLLGLRHQSMGVDLRWTEKIGYLGSFEQLADMPWSTEKHLNYEIGFIWFNKAIAIFTLDRQWYLAICAAVSIFPIAYIIRRYSSDIQTSFIVFFGTPCFVLLFSGLRQAIAMGILFLGYKFIRERKPIKFIITVWIATLFHDTAFIFLIAYPVYKIKLDDLKKAFFIFIVGVMYVLRRPLLSTFGSLITEKSEVQETGAFGLFALYIIGLIAFFFLLRRAKRATEGCINLYYLACISMIFSTVNTLAMRAANYFTPFMFLIVPEIYNYEGNAVLYVVKTSDNNNKVLLGIIVNVIFIALGFYFLVTTPWAKAVPYYYYTAKVSRFR